MTDLQARNAELKDDRDTWKARAEFSYGQRDALQAQLDAIRTQEPVGYKPISDAQWMNIVNANHAWSGYGYDVSDAVHQVVKLVEEKATENNRHLYTHAPDSAARIAELERERDEYADEARRQMRHVDTELQKIEKMKSALHEAKEAFNSIVGFDSTDRRVCCDAAFAIKTALGEE